MNYLPPGSVDNSQPNSRCNSSDRINPPQIIAPVAFIRSPIVAPRTPGQNGSGSGRKQRNPWTKEEDQTLLEIMQQQSDNKPCWAKIAEKVSFARSGKQCRERWQNHLRPNIKKGMWTLEEEAMILNMYHTFGPKWSCMAKIMKNRTDNDIKNKWNSMFRTQRAKAAKLVEQEANSEETIEHHSPPYKNDYSETLYTRNMTTAVNKHTPEYGTNPTMWLNDSDNIKPRLSTDSFEPGFQFKLE